MKLENKITKYLNEQEEAIGGTEQINYLEDDELLEKMHDFLKTLNPIKLSEWQNEELVKITDELTNDKKG